MIEEIVPVTWKGQDTPDFCGPAVAQMFLGWLNIPVAQSDLWTEIQANSDGKGNGPITFPGQVCINCGTAHVPAWRCWKTTAEALEKTIELRAPSTRLATEYAATYEAGLARLIDSLELTPRVPPLATLYTINHWVVVNGYRREDLGSIAFPPVTAGKYHVNGVYILDPLQEDQQQRVRLIAASASVGSANWSEMFGLIPCGDHVDERPMIVGQPVSSWVKWILIIVIWLLLLWWLVYLAV